MTNMPLLEEVIAAHGGAKRWARVQELKLQVRIGGNILALRFKSPRTRALEVAVDTRRVYISLSPFPRRGMRGIFDGRNVRIETNEEGRLLTQREVVRAAGGKAVRRIVWDDLDLLYFLGYALWNYAVTPFVFLWPGFECREGDVWQERDGSVWRRLHVTYPPALPTHSRQQTCYFDEAGLLRRLDYTAGVFCDWARGAHYCEAHKEFDDLLFPTYRVVFARRASGHPFRLVSLMEGWVDNVIVQ
jgi:hypothetical protein